MTFRDLDTEKIKCPSLHNSKKYQSVKICFSKGPKTYMPDKMQNSSFLDFSDPLTCTLKTYTVPLLCWCSRHCSVCPLSPLAQCVPLSGENGQCQAIQPKQRDSFLSEDFAEMWKGLSVLRPV